MKCFKHTATDAVAHCVYCGRGLCPACIHAPSGPRVVCSADCAAGLARSDEALSRLSTVADQIFAQSLRSARASAFYCYLGGGLSAGAALVAWFMLPSPFLILFTAGCAVALTISGFWYGRAARKRD